MSDYKINIKAKIPALENLQAKISSMLELIQELANLQNEIAKLKLDIELEV